MHARRARRRGSGQPSAHDVGIIVGEHPFEEAAAEAGVNLVKRLKSEGVRAELFMVPVELTYARVLPALLEAFNSGEISEGVLKANLSHNNLSRDALLWMKNLVDSRPDAVFYSMHNFVAKFHRREDLTQVGGGDMEFSGWVPIQELTVRRYKSEEEMTSPEDILRRFMSGVGVTREELDSLNCHIGVASGPSAYYFQSGDRRTLKPEPLDKIPATVVRVNTVELPGLQTHFRGEPTPALTDTELNMRFSVNAMLFSGLEEMTYALGLTGRVKDPDVLERLFYVYSGRWSVFDRDINRRAGLTGDYVVKPLAEHIKQDLKRVERQKQ